MPTKAKLPCGRLSEYPTLTVAELIKNVNATGSSYFSASNMRFFGDTTNNYSVSSKLVMVDDTLCYKLKRKSPVKHGLINPAYFCCETFNKVT